MSPFKYLLIILILSLSLKANVHKDLYLGVMLNKFNKSNQNRFKHLILKIIKEIELSYEEKIYVSFIENDKNLLKDFEAFKKINVIIVTPRFYLDNKEKLKEISFNPFLFNHNSDRKTQYYLIANKSSKIKSIKDLKGKVFASFVLSDSYIMWLDYLIRKSFGASYEKIVKKREIEKTTQTLLLDVYFNKSDFTVVSDIVYHDMILLNPAIKKNLIIIEKSKPIFFLGVGFFNKKTSQKIVNIFRTFLNDGTFNERFAELFILLDAYGIQKTTFEDLEEIEKLYDEYKILEKRDRK